MQATDYPSRTFAYPFYIRVLFTFGFLFFGALGLISQMNNENSQVAFLFIVFMFLCLYLLYRMSSQFEVNNTEIRQKVLLGREKILLWPDISSIKGSTLSGSLKLCGSICITIDSYIDRYDELVDFVMKACPNMGNMHKIDTFSRNPWLNIIGIIFSAIVIIPGIRGLLQNEILAGIELMGLGILVLILTLNKPQKVTIKGDTLYIKYLISKRSIHATELYEIGRRKSSIPFIRVKSSIILILANGHKIELAGFAEDSLMENTLKSWREQNMSSINLRQEAGNEKPYKRV